VTHRYTAEFLPLLTVLLCAFFASPLVHGLLARLLPFLVALSAAATLAGVVHWNLVFNGDAPLDQKERLARLFTSPPRSGLSAGLRRVWLSEGPPLSVGTDAGPVKKDLTFTTSTVSACTRTRRRRGASPPARPLSRPCSGCRTS
jgi:hypothetical protein